MEKTFKDKDREYDAPEMEEIIVEITPIMEGTNQGGGTNPIDDGPSW